ncbi:MAG: hypothetical protein NTZ67_09850 [Gammaproteobacteria bacterium]|nr:hypothetical protein [Gammaproteobacteria bacterium]
MPMSDDIKLLQAEFNIKLEAQKKLGYFSSAVTVKAAKEAVDAARKNLNEAMAREKNPNWKSHQELFSADAKHQTDWSKRAENKKPISSEVTPKQAEKAKPLAFSPDAEHKPVKRFYDPLTVHLERDKRNAAAAEAEKLRIAADEARIVAEENRLKKAGEDKKKFELLQNKKVDEAHAKFIKEEPKSFVRAMLYGSGQIKEGRESKVIATVVEKKPGDMTYLAHINNFNSLQRHKLERRLTERLQDETKKTLEAFSPIPSHTSAELEKRQSEAARRRFESSYLFKSRNHERLNRIFENQQKIDAAKQEKREALVDYVEYRNADVAESKARDKNYMDLVKAGKNERRTNILNRFGGETPEQRAALRVENRSRLFNVLSPRNQKEISVQNIFGASLKLKA